MGVMHGAGIAKDRHREYIPNMESGYILVDPRRAKDHYKMISARKGTFALGSSPLEIPAPGIVRDILVAMPGFRLMTMRGEGDPWLAESTDYLISAYSHVLKRSSNQLTLANQMADPEDLDEDTPIRFFDPLVLLRSVEERVKKCGDCGGRGYFDCDCKVDDVCWDCQDTGRVTCEGCAGEQGWSSGTMVVIANDRDDYFWVTLYRYSDATNPDHDHDFSVDPPVMYRCDQLHSLLEFAAGPEFREFVG
jgi:hypothetical protein